MKYLITFFLLLFISCKKEMESYHIKKREPKQISLMESSKKENLEDFIKKIEIVKLKTDIKLVGINKIVHFEDQYYVLDKKTSQLLIFDNNGSFVRKIGERGRGPAEYQKILDFEIDKTSKQILVLAHYDKALYKFTFSGDFIERTVFDFFVNSGFALSNKNTYIFMPGIASSNSHSLVRTDTDGNIIGYDFPFPKNMPIKGIDFSGGLHKQGKTNYFTEPTSSIIYEVNDSIVPLYQFNFGSNTWKEKDRYDIDKFIHKFMKFEGGAFLNNFYCDTDSVLAFQFSKGRYKRKGYYFKDTNKAIAAPYNLEDSFIYKIIKEPVGIRGNRFISSLDYVLYEKLMASQEAIDFKESYPEFYNTLKHDLRDFTENDNPYLLIYEVKENK